MTPRLLRAWRATDYVVGAVVVRIGRRSVAMDALLHRAGTRTGVFVTAWNPLSRPMPQGWNRRMQSRLVERLRRCVWLQADGSLHRWREAHLLVAGNPRPVLRLARLFRQRGVVIVRRHQAARLVVLDRHDPKIGATEVRLGPCDAATVCDQFPLRAQRRRRCGAYRERSCGKLGRRLGDWR